MQIRITRSRSKGKIYEYAQLVESFRRPSDGLPTHRVLANLGPPDSKLVENLRASLDATRQNKRVVVSTVSQKQTSLKPIQNLRYLDLAVLYRIFYQSGLEPILTETLADSATDVPTWKVILALILLRCVAPRSKLRTECLFTETALPELLDVTPNKFNNTRLHRALNELHDATPALMAKVSRLVGQRNAPKRSLFIDLTDTWFVGYGPEMAKKGKAKEGFIKRKIGIVLLCNASGLPLRWQVVSGNTEDGKAMHAMLDDIKTCAWVKQRPLVCDRAMGNTADIEKLLDRKLHFVTALVRTEFDNYTDAIPYQPFCTIDVDNHNDKRALQRVKQALATSGMSRVNDSLWSLDLGIIHDKASQKAILAPVKERASNNTTPSSAKGSPQVHQPDLDDHTVQTIRLGRQVRDLLDSGQINSLPQAASLFECSFTTVKKAVRLARQLSESIQQDILNHQAPGVSCRSLVRLLRNTEAGESSAQRREFDKLCEQGKVRSYATHHRCGSSKPFAPRHPNLMENGVRAIVVFNPEYFLQKRANAQEKLRTIETYTRNLNHRLQKPTCRMSRTEVLADVMSTLRLHTVVSLFRVTIDENKDKSLQVTLTLDREKWHAKRRFDGFNLIVAAPQITLSAEQIAQVYRDKDAVEKDFQTIKSFIKLRPIYHQTDCKVDAHVTVCVLALLVERLLEERLDAVSAQTALETLGLSHLNLYETSKSSAPPIYLVTSPNVKQSALLKHLKMMDLVDDDLIAEQISPR